MGELRRKIKAEGERERGREMAEGAQQHNKNKAKKKKVGNAGYKNFDKEHIHTQSTAHDIRLKSRRCSCVCVSALLKFVFHESGET